MRYSLILTLMLISACTAEKNEMARFMVADPGHFHAALVFKEAYAEAEQPVFVYAPDGPELRDFKSRVEAYQSRTEQPTQWQFNYYTGDDFFERLLSDQPGNVLVLAGNNQKKTEYILDAVKAGLHVYSDKPMAINPADFDLLAEAFTLAGKNKLLLYDIMTERFEITSILQKELMHIPEIFGELLPGTPGDPSVIKESVHHFFKYVSGKKLQRPPWFFDVEQEGEGIVDVTTHLIDLIQWACFPEQIVDYQKDIVLLGADRWPTVLLPEQFAEVTALSDYPDYLQKYTDAEGKLGVYCNGSIDYRLFGVNCRVQVIWNYQAPEGAGDTHYSVIRGSKASLEIRQGAEQGYRPELYLLPQTPGKAYDDGVAAAFIRLEEKFPGIELTLEGEVYRILIPDRYRIGHEAHFGEVTRTFLSYFERGELPEWEVPNMLAKYYLTTQALVLANSK